MKKIISGNINIIPKNGEARVSNVNKKLNTLLSLPDLEIEKIYLNNPKFKYLNIVADEYLFDVSKDESLRDIKFKKNSLKYDEFIESNQFKIKDIELEDKYLKMSILNTTKLIKKNSNEIESLSCEVKHNPYNWAYMHYGRILKIEKKINNRYYSTIKFPILVDNKKIIAGYTIDITESKAKEEDENLLMDKINNYNDILEANILQKSALLDELEIIQKNLEEINTTKDKFFSIIAHDLKSPFSGFMGLTKILATNLQDLSINEIKEFAVNMSSSAINLYALLENLLEWSRMQRGVTDFNPEDCDLSFIIKQNLDLVKELARLKDIKLISKINENYQIFADVQMINTVVRNLISNAVKFTGHYGQIEIGITNKIIFGSFFQNIIYVKDSGVGMDQQTIEKLFNLVDKVTTMGTDNEPSTGLGLVLCKEFIEKHNGKIWAESEVGCGSTFFVYLPDNLRE